jgi:hypothetical protein
MVKAIQMMLNSIPAKHVMAKGLLKEKETYRSLELLVKR